MTRMTATLGLVLLLAGIGGPVTLPAQDRAEVDLRRAIETETVKRDLKNAIEQYRKLADGKNLEAAVQALLRLARVYELLRDAEAQAVYEHIIARFPEQKDAVEKAAVEEASRRLAVLRGPKQREALVATGQNDVSYRRPSPDGRYLVGAHGGAGVGVFLYDTMLDVERQLIPDSAVVKFPIFTPDGRRVVYARFEGDRGEIRSVNIDGSDVKTLYSTTQHSELELSAVSPDGKLIALGLVLRDGAGQAGPNTRTPFWQIGLVGVDTGELEVLKSLEWRDTYSGNFSPDGKWLVYSAQVSEDRGVRDLGVFAIAVDGSADHPLVGRPMAAGAPFFTPDGSRVVFISGSGLAANVPSQKTLYAVRVADGRPLGAPEGISSNISSGRWPAWLMGFSRDGSIYYDEIQYKAHIRAADLEPGTWKLKGTPSAISDPFRHRLPLDFAWSPDARKVAYVDVESEDVLVIHDLQSGDERTYSSGSVSMTLLGWTPDGKSVLLNGPPQGLRLVDLETRRERPVPLQTPSPMLSRDGKSILYLADQQPSAQGAAPDAVRTVQLKRHDLETGSEEVLRSMTVQGPWRMGKLSPDGRFLALLFAEPGEEEALRVVPLDGGPARVLPFVVPPSIFAFTPDGSAVLFTQSNEVWVYPLNGGEAYATGLRQSGLSEIELNPEGNRVAFSSVEPIRQVWAYRNLVP